MVFEFITKYFTFLVNCRWYNTTIQTEGVTTLNDSKIIEALCLATPYIHKVLKGEAIVAVADKQKDTVECYLAGRKVDSGYRNGQKVNPGDNNVYTAFRGKNADVYIDKSVYGVPIKAFAFPVYENSKVVGALAIGLPVENEEKMKGYMETMHSIIESLQDRVHIIASHSEELSATSEEIKAQSEHALADSERTNGITVLIKNISQQTNLLGLNASIEAARAGQHGAGFNIVAQEVRKLSSQTASATDQIDDSLVSIKRNIESLKTSMGQISEASSEQAHLVQDFSDIIDELNNLSTEMSAFLKDAL